MKKVFVKNLGMIEVTEENREVLEQLGIVTKTVSNDTIKEESIEPIRADIKRVSKPRKSK